MLHEWMNWVSSLRTDQILATLGILLLIDAPRYAGSALLMVLVDVLPLRRRRSQAADGAPQPQYSYCPQVTVLIAGHNEADTIAQTMASVWTRYPHLELIVVDDGSTDGMTRAALDFAAGRSGILVLRRAERGGKSSALNLGLLYATSEIVVTVDADSRISDNAIYEIIQPLQDPETAAVSANVMAWNPFASLAAMLQAYEYRQTIFVSRMVRGRSSLLGIVSGAFGAFRTDVLKQLGGWDVGPGEDGDLILRLRKAGFRIGNAPAASCYTNVPVSWYRLFRQRCRWDRTVITFECRKHGDLGCPWSRNFRWSNFLMLLERWTFNVVCVYMFWLYGIWLLLAFPASTLRLLPLLYCCGLCIELLQLLALLFYSDRPKQDLILATVLPLYPIYQVYLKLVDLIALTNEIVFRSSTRDNFVPAHVREVTWHW